MNMVVLLTDEFVSRLVDAIEYIAQAHGVVLVGRDRQLSVEALKGLQGNVPVDVGGGEAITFVDGSDALPFYNRLRLANLHPDVHESAEFLFGNGIVREHGELN